VAQNVGLIHLVQIYSSMSLPWEFLIQKCDTIMPRYYTIASSAVVHPEQIRIAISLSTYKTFDGKEKLGLTSAYLKEMM
jgi:NADPH-ferrihemoprotein reductase